MRKAILVLFLFSCWARGGDASLVDKIPFETIPKDELKGDLSLSEVFKLSIQKDQRLLKIRDQNGMVLFSQADGSVWGAIAEKNRCVLLIRKRHGLGYNFSGLLVLKSTDGRIQSRMLGDGYLVCGDNKGMWVTDIVKFRKDDELEVRSTVFKLDNMGPNKKPEEYEKWSAIIKLTDADKSGNQPQ
ncbi:hypothetical protein KBB96_07590 [Luteolibacter ambystomatis]|uniref:Uncharacterized protein n=1 Tax=Luteolibacter ambystomatis TaxID=2824561 RepID=A0A975J2G4_9BACT|nr:hypothetical protein [Luteolibacter ambystomatis]QUE52746.1 hypothetical protein KBB96_07590 [Luteolibacter ambystomatis]